MRGIARSTKCLMPRTVSARCEEVRLPGGMETKECRGAGTTRERGGPGATGRGGFGWGKCDCHAEREAYIVMAATDEGCSFSIRCQLVAEIGTGLTSRCAGRRSRSSPALAFRLNVPGSGGRAEDAGGFGLARQWAPVGAVE